MPSIQSTIYTTFNAATFDEGGYRFLPGRTDDIITVAGSASRRAAWSRCRPASPRSLKCAVIGAADPIKGDVPCGFLGLKAGVDKDSKAIEADTMALTRERIGPVAAFKTALIVERLRRRGKILRGTMKKIAENEEVRDAGGDRITRRAGYDRRGVARAGAVGRRAVTRFF